MSIPKNEPNTKNFVDMDGQGDFFKPNSYFYKPNIDQQSSQEMLMDNEYTLFDSTNNPSNEQIQLASTGKFTPYISKLLGFDNFSVLNKSKKIFDQKQKLIKKGVNPKNLDADTIQIDNSWNNYMVTGENSVLVNPKNIAVNDRNKFHLDNTKILLEQGKLGNIDKRGPIKVLQLENGTYEILDGNGTVHIANQNNWEDIPAIVFKSKEEYKAYEADLAKKKKESKSQDDQDAEYNKVITDTLKNDAEVNQAGGGLFNNKEADDFLNLDPKTSYYNDRKADRDFYSVGTRKDADGKNIFGENEAEAVANKLANKNNDGASEVDDKGMLTGFRAYGTKDGQVNPADKKLPDENNIYTAINTIAENENYQGRIKENNRDYVTNESTKILADMIGTNPKKLASSILGRLQGGVIVGNNNMGLAETMLAARQFLVKELGVLDGLAEKAVNGTNADKLAFRQQLEFVAQIQAQIKGSQTEIARALQQFSIPVRTGQSGAEMKADDINNILEDFGGSDDITDIAKKYIQAGDSHNKLAYARATSKFRKLGDALYEAWINILLSSPVTHIKNTTGAFLQTFAHGVEGSVAVGLNRMGMLLGKEDSGLRMSDVQASFFGMFMSMQDAYKMAGNGFKYGEKAIHGSKFESGGGRLRQNAFSSEDGGVFGTVVNGLGRIATLDRVPTRMLEWEDTFIKVMAQRQHLYEMAMRTGRGKGLEGDALAEHIAQYVTDPPANVLKDANAHAKYVTLQTDLDKLGNNLKGFRDNALIRYFVPFFKTPYNATKYALGERTFLATWTEKYQTLKNKAEAPNATKEDKINFQKAKTRMHMGNGTAIMVMGMGAQGLITGGGPTDPEVRSQLRQSGWQPYSIKVGDKYYSYIGAEPFSSILSVFADASELMLGGTMNDDDREELAMSLTIMLSNQLTDKTFMQGFSQLINTISDPQRYGGNMVDSYIKSVVPRAFNLAEKIYSPEVKYARGLIDKIQAQIPGWSDSLETKRNVWGQKVLVGETLGPSIMSPIYTSTLGENFANDKGTESMPDRGKRAHALNQHFIHRDKGVFWGPKKPEENLFIAGVGEFEISDKELAVYHEVRGMYLIENLEETIESDEYQALYKLWMDSDGSDKRSQEKMHLLLRQAEITARDMAVYWMLNDEESKTKDELNSRITRYIELKNRENEIYEKKFNQANY